MYPNWPTKSSTVFYTFKEWSTFFFFKRVFKFLNIYKLKEILFKDCNNLILIFQKQLENLLLIVVFGLYLNIFRKKLTKIR